MGQKVVHFEIIGKDGKGLQDFYSRLFDWKIDANNPQYYGQVASEDSGIGGGIAASRPEEPNRMTIYIEVDDLGRFLKKAEGHGGKTILEPIDVPGGPRLAMFTDPEGNIVGLLQAGSMPQ
jgi:predicted enzyme related to lactoylglutathione lyase